MSSTENRRWPTDWLRSTSNIWILPQHDWYGLHGHVETKTQIRKYYYTGHDHKRSSMRTHWCSHRSSTRTRKTKFLHSEKWEIRTKTIRRRIASEIGMVESKLNDSFRAIFFLFIIFTKLVATWTRTSRLSMAWTPKHSMARSPMARSPMGRPWLVWRFSPQLETVFAGPIWGPTRLPMERSRMVTAQTFYKKVVSCRHCNMSCTRRKVKTEELVARTLFSVLLCLAHARLRTFNHACTRDSSLHKSLCTCDVWSGLLHCASKKHLFIFDVSSQSSQSPSWVVHLVFLYTITATSDNMLYETGEGMHDIRYNLSATAPGRQSGYLADSIPLTQHVPAIGSLRTPEM